MSNIKSIKNKFKESLEGIFLINEIKSIWNQWVVREILNISLIDYFLKQDFEVDKKTTNKINYLISHLLLNKPVEYFFGYTYFKDIKIYVNSNVLIPRPETEELVDIVLQNMLSSTNFNTIDIGTGSGCIAIALKTKLKSKSKVFAVDYCNKILSKARSNARKTGVSIDFRLVNILNIQESDCLPNFDVIVSNPPYVLSEEVTSDSIVHAEPNKSIFVPKKNPLIFYEAICVFANKKLNPGGQIFFEINPKLISKLLNILSMYNYSNVEIRSDFCQKKRFIIVYS